MTAWCPTPGHRSSSVSRSTARSRLRNTYSPCHGLRQEGVLQLKDAVTPSPSRTARQGRCDGGPSTRRRGARRSVAGCGSDCWVSSSVARSVGSQASESVPVPVRSPPRLSTSGSPTSGSTGSRMRSSRARRPWSCWPTTSQVHALAEEARRFRGAELLYSSMSPSAMDPARRGIRRHRLTNPIPWAVPTLTPLRSLPPGVLRDQMRHSASGSVTQSSVGRPGLGPRELITVRRRRRRCGRESQGRWPGARPATSSTADRR